MIIRSQCLFVCPIFGTYNPAIIIFQFSLCQYFFDFRYAIDKEVGFFRFLTVHLNKAIFLICFNDFRNNHIWLICVVGKNLYCFNIFPINFFVFYILKFNGLKIFWNGSRRHETKGFEVSKMLQYSIYRLIPK